MFCARTFTGIQSLGKFQRTGKIKCKTRKVTGQKPDNISIKINVSKEEKLMFAELRTWSNLQFKVQLGLVIIYSTYAAERWCMSTVCQSLSRLLSPSSELTRGETRVQSRVSSIAYVSSSRVITLVSGPETLGGTDVLSVLFRCSVLKWHKSQYVDDSPLLFTDKSHF